MNILDTCFTETIINNAKRIVYEPIGHKGNFGYKYPVGDMDSERDVWIYHSPTTTIYSVETPQYEQVPDRFFEYGDVVKNGNETFFIPRANGSYPSFFTIMMMNGKQMLRFNNSDERLGPDTQMFCYDDPYNQEYWDIVSYGVGHIKWTNKMDDKFNFFGTSFFRNDLDRIAFLSGAGYE